jgi:hypothetical protein
MNAMEKNYTCYYSQGAMIKSMVVDALNRFGESKTFDYFANSIIEALKREWFFQANRTHFDTIFFFLCTPTLNSAVMHPFWVAPRSS